MIEFDQQQQSDGNLVGALGLLAIGFIVGIVATALVYHLVIR